MNDSGNHSPDRAIAPILSSVPATVRDLLAPVINLSDEGIYHEPTCPFCCNTIRSRAEAYFKSLDPLSRGRAENLQRWLLEQGENIPFDVIRNHVQNHLDKGDSEFRKVEYLNKLSNLSAVELGSLDRIKLALAAVEERMTSLAAMVSPKKGDIQFEEKKSKAINDLVKTYKALIELQNQLIDTARTSQNVFVINKTEFELAFDKALQKASKFGKVEFTETLAALLDDLEKAASNLVSN